MARNPNGDYAAQPKSDQLDIELYPSASANKAIPVANSPVPPEPPEGTIKPVDEIMVDHHQQVAERGARHETLTDANWLPGRITEALDREFPDLRTPEKIEQLDKKQDANVRRQARATRAPKRAKSTRYISPRDTGPPLHIAKEMRGE
ncbi:MAG: hypothetical protein WD887_00685 [Candidatus Saccharimonadales bacterium]